jgi:triosephosphate isomerase
MPANEKRPLFAGNWKLFGSLNESITLASEVQAGVAELTAANVVVAPSFTALASVAKRLEGGPVAVAGQDCYWETKGAFTGEVSAAQLADVGCRYVILGHSERRQLMGETDAGVNRKTRAALAAGLLPIVCVGETLAEREAGKTEETVKRQLAAVIHVNGHCISEIVVAYEPVWAIGTGKTATPEEAQQVHAVLRAQLHAATDRSPQMRILYGGSMNAANAAQLLAQPDIDGGLIGGAALKAPDFLTIVTAAG